MPSYLAPDAAGVPLSIYLPTTTVPFGAIFEWSVMFTQLFTDGQCFIASKSFTVFPANAKVSKPAHQGVTLLFEADHGTLLSIADAHQVSE